MSNLYTNLALVYEAMYLSFIDYEEEFHFYSKILKAHDKNKLLEIGCGTGNLAYHFIQNKFNYTGLDLSNAMLTLAKNKNKSGKFLLGDMRKFLLKKTVESIIVTGRTINYLVTDNDINAAFACFQANLTNSGILCFDFIDADEFLPMIQKNKRVHHEASFSDTIYKRKSTWEIKLMNGYDFEWRSVYYKKEGVNWQEIGTDSAEVRTFTLKEISHFLVINGFKIKDSFKRATYAFPTYVVVAEKLHT